MFYNMSIRVDNFSIKVAVIVSNVKRYINLFRIKYYE